MVNVDDGVREEVRRTYADAALAVTQGGGGCCGGDGAPNGVSEGVGTVFGPVLYDPDQKVELPGAAVQASLGCGNPTAVADLREGERVLDLGSGGGIDVLLSARRVGPAGFVYGLDMTDEMLALARRNAAEVGAGNVEFLKGSIEEVPLPDASVEVVISNCVINLSMDKVAVFREMFRVLAGGGRLGLSDVVAEDHLSPADRAERGSHAGCIAGALSRTEYLEGLAAVGFRDPSVSFTHEVAPGMHGAIIRATKPGSRDARTEESKTMTSIRTIEVFEPALCCNTGVCGPDPSEQLINFTADAAHLASRGVRVLRHNLANDPHAFVNNPAANAFLHVVGSEGLPLVLVDGVTVATGSYPDRDRLEKLAGLHPEPVVGADLGLTSQGAGGCCGGGGSC